ncbi:MAG: cysteine dioxygenase [Blastocatellia bacterium]
MRTITIEQLIAGLCAIPEGNFQAGTVYDYLKNHPVDESSLRPYLFFSQRQYTRNLIFKTHLFELIALCWESGQASTIHNHAGQNCWMALPTGRLRIQNFRVIEQDAETAYCRIEPAEAFDIDRLKPAEVDPTEPVHQVLNLAEFGRRAVSLHIYSRPIDRCLVYSSTKNQYGEVVLRYTSEYGKLAL